MAILLLTIHLTVSFDGAQNIEGILLGAVDELLDPRLLTVAGCELQIGAADENPVETDRPHLGGDEVRSGGRA